eukprot:gene18511-biopygen20451
MSCENHLKSDGVPCGSLALPMLFFVDTVVCNPWHPCWSNHVIAVHPPFKSAGWPKTAIRCTDSDRALYVDRADCGKHTWQEHRQVRVTFMGTMQGSLRGGADMSVHRLEKQQRQLLSGQLQYWGRCLRERRRQRLALQRLPRCHWGAGNPKLPGGGGV